MTVCRSIVHSIVVYGFPLLLRVCQARVVLFIKISLLFLI